MNNARAGRLVLLGAAACMLVTLSGAPAADAAGARLSVSSTAGEVQGHPWIGSEPIGPPTAPADIQGHGWIGSEPIGNGSTTGLLFPPDGATAPSRYAQITFDAWVRADHVELEKRGTPAVAEMLEARPWIWDDEWAEKKDCEGAAGSTYCTWTGASAQLTLRAANERAASGEPHAVTEAVLDPLPGKAVALWPLTTQEEVDNTQKQVDQGHSPWLLYPDTVATFYAEVELSWNNPRVRSTGNGTFRVIDRATGAEVDVLLGQPARTGDGGVWAVTSLRSASSR